MTALPNAYLTTKYGERCLVLRHATHDKPSALVRRKDGSELELFYEDLRGGGANVDAFYGNENVNRQTVRITRKLREMRSNSKWKVVFNKQ